jgi:hypothetical protein
MQGGAEHKLHSGKACGSLLSKKIAIGFLTNST